MRTITKSIMVKCPYCNYERKFTLIKTWRYRWWSVFYYKCPECGGRFRYQFDSAGKRKNESREGICRGYLNLLLMLSLPRFSARIDIDARPERLRGKKRADIRCYHRGLIVGIEASYSRPGARRDAEKLLKEGL